MGRATQGVTLIAVDDGSQLAGLQRIVESDVGEDGAEGSEETEAADDAQGQDSPDTTLQ
jgi:DNA gyrase subunit A